MSKNVIVSVADKSYINHVYSLFGNLRKLGNYTGDLALVYNGEIDPETYKYLHERNIKILNVPECYCFFAKFYVFYPFFKQWEKVLYLDCDIWVKNDINCIFEQEGNILIDQEEFKISQYFTNSDNYLYQELQSWFKEFNNLGYNTSAMLINSKIICEDSTSKLFALAEKYKKINQHLGPMGSDQSILNIAYYTLFEQIRHISFVQRPANNPLLHGTNWYFKYSGEYYDKGLEFFKELKM